MSSSRQSQTTCRCRLHGELEARRHDCYRQLARAILGPAAPKTDLALAHALAEHARLLEPVTSISQFRSRRDAA